MKKNLDEFSYTGRTFPLTPQSGIAYIFKIINFVLPKDKMSSISVTKLYELLVPKLGRETAENLTRYMEEKMKGSYNDITQKIAMKADLEIFATKADLANTKTDMIKWMFAFWIGQIVTTFGFILLYLKK